VTIFDALSEDCLKDWNCGGTLMLWVYSALQFPDIISSHSLCAVLASSITCSTALIVPCRLPFMWVSNGANTAENQARLQAACRSMSGSDDHLSLALHWKYETMGGPWVARVPSCPRFQGKASCCVCGRLPYLLW